MSMILQTVVFAWILFGAQIVCGQKIDTAQCGNTTGCLWAPEGCEKKGNCKITFTYKVNGTDLQMEILGTPEEEDAYIAVGFSKDNKMGSDMVVFCARFRGMVSGGLATILHDNGIFIMPDDIRRKEQVVDAATNSNGVLYCKIRMESLMIMVIIANESEPSSTLFSMENVPGSSIPLDYFNCVLLMVLKKR
ncbi:hypothetical protein NECAME_17004 [Necator americanus]|uniref:DOMON domain-containing protein n=1 Tax=Necator americanus TaxID=51031 RepID=W2TSR4_NECAM|nr:hypothetical protein NECAME_17004 [Necator americanus]ETN84783.1 hypothetical protein NECAME_17004 [Necator americanus]